MRDQRCRELLMGGFIATAVYVWHKSPIICARIVIKRIIEIYTADLKIPISVLR